LLTHIRRTDPDLPVIMISSARSPVNVVEAMRCGASDFIAKPLNPEDLRNSLNNVLASKPPTPLRPSEPPISRSAGKVYVSNSPSMQELQELTDAVGWSQAPVLIQGETGVGKEVLARELHQRSPRSTRLMLKLNCAALPSELVESELFGYERGAFTGAFQRKPGMFELANGGTILLDEIGDMDFRLQAKLLQVLQDQEFQRLGGKDTISVDVRVIAATHCDLQAAMARKQFREDLYYRLNVITLRVPPLRERREDIIPLLEFFLRKHLSPGKTPPYISPALQDILLEYPWPGNVRELENTARKLLIVYNSRFVEQDLRDRMSRHPLNGMKAADDSQLSDHRKELPFSGLVPVGPAARNGINGHGPSPVSCREPNTPLLIQVANAKREAERAAILAALKATNWNRRQAAVQLQTDYKCLLYKMKVLSIKKEQKTSLAAVANG
jgi:two-component system response regulator AtoC